MSVKERRYSNSLGFIHLQLQSGTYNKTVSLHKTKISMLSLTKEALIELAALRNFTKH